MLISGGQTGIDRAALDFAIETGIACSGWCPLGRKAEDGPIPAIYPLQETTSEKYQQRTRLNVKDSDATLILTDGSSSRGTALTINLCLHYHRPFFILSFTASLDNRQSRSTADCIDKYLPAATRDAAETAMLEQASEWLFRVQPRILNVAGPRASECPSGAAIAKSLFISLLQKSESLPPEWPPHRPYTPDLPIDHKKSRQVHQ